MLSIKLLPSLVWPLPICLDSWTWHSRFLCNIALYSIRPCFYHQSHPQLGIVLLWLHPFILSGVISPVISSSNIGHLLTWGVSLSVSYHFAFSYCLPTVYGKNLKSWAAPLNPSVVWSFSFFTSFWSNLCSSHQNKSFPEYALNLSVCSVAYA